MTNMTKYSSTPTQSSSTTSNHYREWTDRANACDSSNNTAKCLNIAGKNGTYRRPSPLKFKNFGFTLPTDADIVSIVVEYAHNVGSIGGAYPNIPAPTISLYNGDTKISSKTGVKPTSSMTGHSLTFTNNVKSSVVNSSNFNVRLSYPTNSNTNPGNLFLKYLRVKVNYKTPSYTLGIINSSSDIREDETFTTQFNITNVNKTSSNPSVSINLPANITYMGKEGGTGTISQTGQTLTWNPNLGSSVAQSSIKLKLQSNSTGSKTISMSCSNATTVTKTITVNSKPVQVEVITPTATAIKNNENYNVTINARATELFNNTSTVYFDIRGDYSTVTFTRDGSSITITPTSYVDSEGNTWSRYSWIPDVSSNLSTQLIATVNANTSVNDGIIRNNVSYSNDLNVPFEVTTYPSTVSAPYYCGIILNNEEISKMANEYPYQVSTYFYVDDSEPHYSSKIPDYSINNRIVVFNEEIPNIGSLRNDEILAYAYTHCSIHSETPKTINAWEEVKCNFNYDERYPVILLLLGEPVYPNDVNVKFTNPCLQEILEETPYQEVGNFPAPLSNVISETETATVTGDSNKFVLYDFPELNSLIDDDENVILGISLSFNYPNQEEISLLASLRINGNLGNRSLTLTEDLIDENEIINLGGEFDRWGLKLTSIEDLQVILSSVGSNTEEDIGTLNINNPMITVYYEQIPFAEQTCYVNGEDTRSYGLILKDVTIPTGIDTDTQYSSVTGTDYNDVYRQNITKKEITIEFDVHTTDLITSTNLMHQISKLFTNKRDEFNKPILNTVEFSHWKDKYFECLLEDSIDNSVVITDYESCKIKLTVPNGTSYSKKEVITYLNGSNDSLVKVNPLIKLTRLSSDITVTETVSEQSFQIRDTELTSISFNLNDYLEINCKDRIATLYKYDSVTDKYEANNVTRGVDFASDWFILNGEYSFTSSGAEIRSISYRERW